MNLYVSFRRHYRKVVYVVYRAAMLNVFDVMDFVASIFPVVLWSLGEWCFAIS